MMEWTRFTPKSKQDVLRGIRDFIESELPVHLDAFQAQRRDYRIEGYRQNNPYIPFVWLEDRLPVVSRKLRLRWNFYLVHIFGKTVRMLAWRMRFRSTEERKALLLQYRDLLRYLLRTRNQTWGLSNAMAGLMDLRRLGLEDGEDYIRLVFDQADIRYMKNDLHWKRHFDAKRKKLIALPNNYFPVMTWVALGRYRLGWDDESMLEYFTEKCLSIFRDLSTHGWFDDTGCGTYDVYHSVATFELTELLHAYDPKLVAHMEPYCNNLVDEYLYMGQLDGSGFPFGRTIGVNGDMWMASGLLVTMFSGFGKKEHYRNYYDLAVAAMTKSMHFWYDKQRHISNKWFDGRKTDPYMDKHRIVDATYDLYLRLIQCHDLIEKLPVDDWADQSPPIDHGGELFVHWQEGRQTKATFVYKDRDLSFSFPLTCHGKPGGWLHYESNYLPNVRTNFFFETPIYVYQPYLNPRITLTDGTSFMPYAFYENVKADEIAGGFQLSFGQGTFLLNRDNKCFDQLVYHCLWLMAGRRFLRLDLWCPKEDVAIASYEYEYAAQGRFTGEEAGTFAFDILEHTVLFKPGDNNLGLRAAHRNVSGDPAYGCYSGQCSTAVTVVSGAQTLRKGQIYFSCFELAVFDGRVVERQSGPPVGETVFEFAGSAVMVDPAGRIVIESRA